MYLGYNRKINFLYLHHKTKLILRLYPKYILTPRKEFDFSLNYK